MALKIIFDNSKRCPDCGSNQWAVPDQYDHRLTRSKNVKDEQWEQIAKDNENLFKQYGKCVICMARGKQGGNTKNMFAGLAHMIGKQGDTAGVPRGDQFG